MAKLTDETKNAATDNVSEQTVEQIINQMIEEAKKATQKMIEDAKTEAEKIVGDARNRTLNGSDLTVDGSIMEDIRKRESEMHKKVRIKLFKDGREYKDPLYVAVNGHNFVIERGVEVEVPRYVEEVIKNMESQNILVSELVAAAEKKLEDGAN